MKLFSYVFVEISVSVSILLGLQVSGASADDVGEAPLVADKELIEKLNRQYKTDPGVLTRVEDSYPYKCHVAEKLYKAGLVPTEDWIEDPNPFKVLPLHPAARCKMSESEAMYFWKHGVIFGEADANKKEDYVLSSSIINLEASSPYSENVSKDEYPGGRICTYSAGFFDWEGRSWNGVWGYVFDQEYGLQKYVRCMYPVDANSGIRTNGGCGRGIPVWVNAKDYPKCIEEYSMKTVRGIVNYFDNFNDIGGYPSAKIFGDDIQEMEDQFNELSKNHSPSVHPWTPDYFNVGSCDQNPAGTDTVLYKDSSNWYNPFYRGGGFLVHAEGDHHAQQRSNKSEINAAMKAHKDHYSCSYYWRIWNLVQWRNGSMGVTREEYQKKQLSRIAWRSWRGVPKMSSYGYNDAVVNKPRVRQDIDDYIDEVIERNPIQAFFIVCNVPDYWGISPRRIQEAFAERYDLNLNEEDPRIPRVVYFDLNDVQNPFKAECPSSKELCSQLGGKFCTRLTGDPHEQAKDLKPAPPTTTTTTNTTGLGMTLGTVAIILVFLAMAMQRRSSRRTVTPPVELLG